MKLYNTALGTIEDLTPFVVVAELLGSYFIGTINYPDAYKSLRRFFEKYIHGALSRDTASRSAHTTYTSLVKRYENMPIE